MTADLPVPSGEGARASGEAALPARVEPAPGYAGPPMLVEPEEPAADPRRILAAIVRYKWLVVTGVVLGAAGGFGLGQLKDPVYEAQATIWIEPSSGPTGPIQEAQLLQNTNWLDLLKSYTVLDSVVTEQHLFVEPARAADTLALHTLAIADRLVPGRYQLKVSDGRFRLMRQGVLVQEGAVGDSIGRRVGLLWAPPASLLPNGRTIEFSLQTPRQAALDLATNLNATLPPLGGNFIRMTLRGPIASRTASTLNSISRVFVSVAAVLKREKLHQLTGILDTQLTQAAEELRRAELALESFRVHTITEPSEQRPPVASGLQETQAPALQNYFTMKTQADQLRRDREAIEHALAHASDSGIAAVQLEGVQSVRDNADLSKALSDLTDKQALLRQMRERYTDDNPAVQDLLNAIHTVERQNVPAMLRTLLAEVRARETALNGRLAVTETDLRQIPARTIEEARLERNVQIAQTLYVNLQSRYSEARLADASSIPDVRVLDAAVVPDRPVKDLELMLLGGGLAGGLGLGIALALLLDRFDKRLQYPDQVTRELNLTILGALPHVRFNGARPEGDEANQVVESLRTIRLNLLHAYGTAGPLITTVTSPGSGDGKSFLASNLAVAMADAGHRTLLIDGDIRRGKLHRVLKLKRKPGLLDYLSGDVVIEDVVQPVEGRTVDFIGSGTRRSGGPELLAAPEMGRLLLTLRSRYDAIIVDCAPLGAGVDPLVLGTLTGSLLLVLRTGVTNRELTLAKLDEVSRLPIRVLGAVLNDVRAAGHYRYYHYLPGYESEEEEDPKQAEWKRRLPAGKD